VELLFALIVSKFAIVAVLSLGGAALDHGASDSVTGLLAGAVLLALAAFAPWAMLRIVPLAEIASGAAASLRGGALTALGGLQRADAWASEGHHHWATTMAQMRDAADGPRSAPRPSPKTPALEDSTPLPTPDAEVTASGEPSAAGAEYDAGPAPAVSAEVPLDPSWDGSSVTLDLESSEPAPREPQPDHK
jgi:hypothetical protein